VWRLILGLTLMAAGDATPPTKADLPKLIRELDADEAATRDAAEKQLLELGVAALNQLPAESKDISAEATKRIQRIRAALEGRLAATAGEASLVTLHGKHSIQDVLQKITEQTENPIHDGWSKTDALLGQRLLELDLDKVPFWEALDEILDVAGLTIAPFSEERGLLLVPAAKGESVVKPPQATQGPFRVLAADVHASRSLEHENQGSLIYDLHILWEPQLRPVAMNLRMASVKGIGDGDEEVSPADRNSDPQIQVPGAVSMAEISLPLSAAPRTVSKLAKLSGTIDVLAISRFEDFRFEPLGSEANLLPKRQVCTIAGVSVALERVLKNEDIWEVHVTAKYPKNKTAMESYQNWMYENEVYLLDPSGKKIDAGGYEQTSEGENTFGVKFLFDIEGSPTGHKLVYRAPISILDIPVAFELKDLDLP
jgi:hypothetical protein